MSYFLDFASKGIRVVGPVPSGIAKFTPPDLSTYVIEDFHQRECVVVCCILC